MSGGPWEDYARPAQPQEAGPWLDFAQSAAPTAAPAQAERPAGDGSAAIGRGLIEGVPVVGPYLLGGVNRLAAGVRSLQNDTKFSDELANVESFGKRTAEANPIASTVGEIGGGVLGTAPLVAAAPAAFGAGAAALPARLGAATVSGGILGGADAAARGQDAGTGAALGAGLGFAGPLVGAGVGRAVGGIANRVSPTAVPSLEELKAGARAAHQRADEAGVQIAQPSFAQAVQDIGTAAREAGVDRTIHPRATAALGRLDEAAGSSPTLKDVDLLRRVIKGASGSIEPDERRIGSIMTRTLDDYVGGLKPADLVSGDAAAATQALGEARGLYARASKSQLLAEALEKADLRAASTGSGGNADNAARQNIRSLLESKKSRGFSEAERDALELTVRGTPTQNMLRLVGKLSPQGNGLMAMSSLYGAVNNPVMAIPHGVGAIAKALADGATTRNARMADALIRNGGEVAESQAAIEGRRRAEMLARALTAPAPALANQRR